ncbi:MAG: prolyl oligopeptidase family serine peptidase, partial [bacterium]|nr:prolyl oligopeptidase family serine peptidase [bacterium]
MRKLLFTSLWLVSILVAVFGGYWVGTHRQEALKSPAAKIIPRPLEKYTYDNLKIRGGIASDVKIERTLKEEDKFTSYLFSYFTNGKRVTGQMNVPNSAGPYPTILMFRGYAEKETYKIGTGTAPSAKVYASNGFLTFAPDFLGYGESEARAEDQIEARLENYTTALDALASIKNIKEADSNNVFIWGHSNGGHLAVATLEISGKPIPTTLWAPVTAPFPHSAL